MNSEIELRYALVDFLSMLTNVLKIVEPLIKKAIEEELDKRVKFQ